MKHASPRWQVKLRRCHKQRIFCSWFGLDFKFYPILSRFETHKYTQKATLQNSWPTKNKVLGWLGLLGSAGNFDFLHQEVNTGSDFSYRDAFPVQTQTSLPPSPLKPQKKYRKTYKFIEEDCKKCVLLVSKNPNFRSRG